MRKSLTALFLCLAALIGDAETASARAELVSENRVGLCGENPNIDTKDFIPFALPLQSGSGGVNYDVVSGVCIGPNLYTYVKQNPWTYYDPHGLFLEGLVYWEGQRRSQGLSVREFAGKSLRGLGRGVRNLGRSVVSAAKSPRTYLGPASVGYDLAQDIATKGEYSKQNVRAAVDGAKTLLSKETLTDPGAFNERVTVPAVSAAVATRAGVAVGNRLAGANGKSPTGPTARTLATTPLDEQVSGIADDAFVHFGPEELKTVKPGAGGETFLFQYGDIKHLTPRKVETVIGPGAAGGVKGGAKFIHVVDDATVKPQRIGSNPDFPEHVVKEEIGVNRSNAVQE